MLKRTNSDAVLKPGNLKLGNLKLGSRRLGRRRIAVGAGVLAAMLLTPSVAQVVFSGSAAQTMSVTTAILAAPDPALTVTSATCDKVKGDSVASVTVDTYATVPGANQHEPTVVGPAGNVVHHSVLEEPGGDQFTFGDKWRKMSGTWTYQIHGSYAVPGSNKVWVGPPLTRTFTCPDKRGNPGKPGNSGNPGKPGKPDNPGNSANSGK